MLAMQGAIASKRALAPEERPKRLREGWASRSDVQMARGAWMRRSGDAPSAIRYPLSTSYWGMSDDEVPDVRDGLTRKERIVLSVLHEIQHERGDHNVPTPMLWGRVCEHFYISPDELSAMLARLGARR